MSKTILISILLILSGCAEVKIAADIIDVLIPDNEPVCSEETRGEVWQNGDKGMICAKIPGGYKWIYFAPINGNEKR